MSDMARRAFLRSVGLAAAAAACSGNGTPRIVTMSPTPAPTTTPASPTATAAGPAWRRITAGGPPARRDATLTGDAARGVAYLFGGRSGSGTSSIRKDFWIYDVAAGSWRAVDAAGAPSARFGHDAGIVGGKLVVFGGQTGPNSFLNDIYTYDPDASRWSRAAGGTAPAPRYGAGDAVVGDRLLISHGFTNSGRFDDTWSWNGTWVNVSPSSGVRPVKRCLHRTAWWPEANAVALFGGQTNGTPFLNDFWLYDTAARTWTKAEPGTLPGPRTLFAMVSIAGRLWIWGGFAPGGEIGDMWRLDDPSGAWQIQSFPDGQAPGPRGGVAACAVSPGEALMFGGQAGGRDLDELWSLRPGTV